VAGEAAEGDDQRGDVLASEEASKHELAEAYW